MTKLLEKFIHASRKDEWILRFLMDVQKGVGLHSTRDRTSADDVRHKYVVQGALIEAKLHWLSSRGVAAAASAGATVSRGSSRKVDGAAAAAVATGWKVDLFKGHLRILILEYREKVFVKKIGELILTLEYVIVILEGNPGKIARSGLFQDCIILPPLSY